MSSLLKHHFCYSSYTVVKNNLRRGAGMPEAGRSLIIHFMKEKRNEINRKTWIYLTSTFPAGQIPNEGKSLS